jgi:integrase
MPSAKKTDRLTEAGVEKLRFAPTARAKYIVRDSELAGFMVMVGVKTKTFRLESERRENGKRVSISRRLGEWPDVKVQEARDSVASVMGERADGRAALGPRQVATVAIAMDSYLDHLARVAKAKDKDPKWRDRVDNMNSKHILPTFGDRSLRWLIENPEAVRDWHAKIALRTPSVANKVATLLGLAYSHACVHVASCRTLPRDRTPNEMVTSAREKKRRTALAFADFPKWFAEVRRIPNETRRCFHMLNLLLGARPGELGRTKIENWDRTKGLLVLKATKNGNDVVLPTNPIIDQWLDRALMEAQRRHPNSEYLFPSRGGYTRRFDGDVTPYGHALRRTYRTLAEELCINERLSESLMGHAVLGMAKPYVVDEVLTGGLSKRAAQNKMTERICELFGSQSTLTAPATLMIAPPLVADSFAGAH